MAKLTRAKMIKEMELIKVRFLAAASAAQNAEDRLRAGLPWRTDELADGNDDARIAVEALRKLL